MYNKKEMKMLANEFLNGNELVDRLEDLRTQMNEMKQDYFSKLEPKLKEPVLKAITIDQVMAMDLNWSERGILLHFLAYEARGINEVYISAAADAVNMNRPAYAKAVRKLADKGYLVPTVKRAVYKLNKVY